jgi:PhnB protein
MPSRLNPYISFKGNAREALEFYQSVLGGDLAVNTFGEFGQSGGEHEAVADQIMHGQLESTAGYTIMAADTPPGMDYSPGTNFAVSLSGDDNDELRGYWEKLSQGGTVMVPLEKQIWGDEFGMCADKFGVTWMVNIAGAQQS